MPLHLLGKKSWNVYNADNIAKVKRDEAAAAAREADEEQRMQEVDAERRIQILRGIHPDPPPAEIHEIKDDSQRRNHDRRPHGKRRRLAGEDDTDRDLRIARENNEAAARSTQALATTSKTSDAPLTDSKGHINLFPEEGPKRKPPKNAEAEAEIAKKKKEYEDQYTMRFSNAAGFKESIGQKPWYSSVGNTQAEEATEKPVSKDVWGNEDPRRKERAQIRLQSDDPMAMIRKGVFELRHVEKERQKWQTDRDREMNELLEVERNREKKKRRREADDDPKGAEIEAASDPPETSIIVDIEDEATSEVDVTRDGGMAVKPAMTMKKQVSRSRSNCQCCPRYQRYPMSGWAGRKAQVVDIVVNLLNAST